MSKLSKLTELKGVGPKLAEQLHKLHIHTLADLFFHLPFILLFTCLLAYLLPYVFIYLLI